MEGQNPQATSERLVKVYVANVLAKPEGSKPECVPPRERDAQLRVCYFGEPRAFRDRGARIRSV